MDRKKDFSPSGAYKTRSVRFRLTAYFIIFSLLLMGALWFLQTVLLESYYESSMEKKVQTAVDSLSRRYSVSGDLDMGLYLSELAEVSGDNDMYFYIEAQDGSFNISSTDQATSGKLYYYGRGGVDLARERLVESESSSVSFKISNKAGDSVTMVYAARVSSDYRSSIFFFAFAPLTPMGPAVGIITMQLLRVTVISLVIAGALAFYISGRIAKPITNITEAAAEMAKGNYGVEFQGSSYKEINDLAGTLNHTAAELSKAESLQRDLLANVSHDLRTPLTMVKSYAELIRDISGENKDKRDEHLGVIIEESDRLSLLVDDILTLSRLQAGVEVMRKAPVDIQKAAESVLNTYRVLEEQEGFTFSFEPLPGVITVEADLRRMEQVISNLLSNAVRYSGDGKFVTLGFSREGERVRCTVTDKGIGISPEDMENIWNRYEKASKQGRRSASGTGLGLSISKEILEMHGAAYGVDSSPGKGSSFWFSMKITENP